MSEHLHGICPSPSCDHQFVDVSFDEVMEHIESEHRYELDDRETEFGKIEQAEYFDFKMTEEEIRTYFGGGGED